MSTPAKGQVDIIARAHFAGHRCGAVQRTHGKKNKYFPVRPKSDIGVARDARVWNALRSMITDTKLDHVALAVHDIPTAASMYVDVFGATFLFAADNDAQGFRFAQFSLPVGGKIEFVASLREGSFVERFLAAHGEGVHHMTLKTDDIHAAIGSIKEAGLTPILVDTQNPVWKEAFIHPREAHGILVQIAESAISDSDMAAHHLSDHSFSEHQHLGFEDLRVSR